MENQKKPLHCQIQIKVFFFLFLRVRSYYNLQALANLTILRHPFGPDSIQPHAITKQQWSSTCYKYMFPVSNTLSLKSQ